MESATSIGTSRNGVEIFVNALEKAMRAKRMYSYAGGQGFLDNILDHTVNACASLFSEGEQIEIDVKPFEMLFEKKVIYQNKEKKTSFSFALYSDGIRLLILRRGLSKEELNQVLQILATDFESPEMVDEDLYCLFVEANLDHFQVVGGDALQEAQQKDPQLKQLVDSFCLNMKAKTQAVAATPHRKLRSEDLKILEEFRLNPAQFARSDEEVSKLLHALVASREGAKKERETLEKLLLMGFHFLLRDQGAGDQLQVGRDLIVRTSLSALQAKFFDLFAAVVQKVAQMQKEKVERSGEYQKILDSLYHIDQSNLFLGLLKDASLEREATRILLMGPPSAVRLWISLIGNHSNFAKAATDFILKGLPHHLQWILDSIQKTPDNPSWEALVNLMSLRPTHHFQKILESLYSSAGPALRSKVLKQMATIGSPDSLRIFEQILQKGDTESRMLAYDLLSQSSGKLGLKILKNHLEGQAFQSAAADEQERAYAAILKVGGELALPWLQNLWQQPGSGLFKKKNEEEKRMLYLKALAKGAPQFVARFLDLVPAQTVSAELRALASRVVVRTDK